MDVQWICALHQLQPDSCLPIAFDAISMVFICCISDTYVKAAAVAKQRERAAAENFILSCDNLFHKNMTRRGLQQLDTDPMEGSSIKRRNALEMRYKKTWWVARCAIFRGS